MTAPVAHVDILPAAGLILLVALLLGGDGAGVADRPDGPQRSRSPAGAALRGEFEAAVLEAAGGRAPELAA